jgi:hypothetical protein
LILEEPITCADEYKNILPKLKLTHADGGLILVVYIDDNQKSNQEENIDDIPDNSSSISSPMILSSSTHSKGSSL